MHILTDTAFRALQILWQQVGDLDDLQRENDADIPGLWTLVANTAEAYSVQHHIAQMQDEADTFTWLQDIALTRVAMTDRRPDVPKLQIVQSMSDILQQ